jgi:hypothetical protein
MLNEPARDYDRKWGDGEDERHQRFRRATLIVARQAGQAGVGRHVRLVTAERRLLVPAFRECHDDAVAFDRGADGSKGVGVRIGAVDFARCAFALGTKRLSPL